MKTLFTLLMALFVTSVTANSLSVCRGESGLYGFCNNTGNIVIPQVYYDAHDFVNGHAPVLVEDKWAIINEAGDEVIPPKYDEVIDCINTGNTLLVRLGEKWQFVDSRGKTITTAYEIRSPRYEFQLNGAVSEVTRNSWFAAIKRGKWGAIDMNNNLVVEFDYEWVSIVRRKVDGTESNVGFILKKKGKYAWQRADKAAGSGFYFDHYLGQSEENLFFEKSGDLMVLDAITGEKKQLEGSNYFTLRNDENLHGLVSAERNNIVVPFKYDLIRTDVVPNHAVFGFYEKMGLTDMWGNVLLQAEYKEIKALGNNPLVLAVRNQASKVAVFAIDANKATQVTDFKYNFARLDDQGIYIGVGNRHGYVTMDGTETWKD